MNRIRKSDNVYQVLITPDIPESPDASSLMVGSWTDEYLRGFYVMTFPTMNAAMAEAFKHADLDWYRLVTDHKEIFRRLDYTIKGILNDNDYDVQYQANLMTPDTVKNTMFDRVLNGGERFNLRSNFNDIITFTIINPWSKVLADIAKKLERYGDEINLDVLRIRDKEIIDGKIIILYGYTEYGTTYEIRLVPSLLHQWAVWHKKNGYRNDKTAENLYRKIMKKQNMIDANNSVVLL
jgi:ABC-type antimicrobial peptide transport system permease subunit